MLYACAPGPSVDLLCILVSLRAVSKFRELSHTRCYTHVFVHTCAATAAIAAVAQRTLYPTSKGYKRGTLRVSHLHTIEYEVHGNPKGQPVLCVHGGPGAGAYANHACASAAALPNPAPGHATAFGCHVHQAARLYKAGLVFTAALTPWFCR